MKECVYKISNLINGRMYIGETLNYHRRKNEHLRLLRKCNHHNKILQYDWNRYGEDCFKFEPLEEIEIKHHKPNKLNKKLSLLYLEDKYIKKYNTIKYGYNMIDSLADRIDTASRMNKDYILYYLHNEDCEIELNQDNLFKTIEIAVENMDIRVINSYLKDEYIITNPKIDEKSINKIFEKIKNRKSRYLKHIL